MNLRPALVLGLIILLSASPALGEPSESGPQPLGLDTVKKAVNLDKPQEDKMRVLLNAFNREKILRDGDIQYKELEFEELSKQDNIDFEKLESRYKELAALRADMGAFRIKTLLAAREFLNDDQFDKYKRMLLRMFLQ